MSALDNIVRPFLPAGTGAPPVRGRNNAQNPDVVYLTITGGSDGLIMASYNQSSSMEYIYEQVTVEMNREYDKLRIKNKDNPEQYVDVELPRKIHHGPAKGGMVSNLGGPNTRTVLYPKQPEADNIEVLEEGKKRRNPEAG